MDLDEYETSPAFTPLQRLVIRYSECLTRTPANVDDQLFASLREHLDERQLVELTSLIAWENYRSRFNRGFNISAQGFSEGSFCALPARHQ